MKILILGDIHGRTIWKDIIEKEQPNKVIFLGDYVSTHNNISANEQIYNLYDILKFKDEWKDKCILLRGNHDIQHLGYSWAECSGFDYEVFKQMSDLKDKFLSNTQWVYVFNLGDKFYVCSHAGISNTWFNRIKKKGVSCLEDINKLEPSELFAFTPDNFNDFCGTSKTQPCTWIRPKILIKDMIPNINQIVGHTSLNEKCINLKEILPIENELWLCDSLNLKSYLLINNNEIISKIYEN